jgi:hypothetical protein
MRWFKRIVWVLAALAIVSGIAVVVVIRFLPETDFIKSAVEQRLRDITGNDIAIASIQIGGSFPDVIRIQLDGVAATTQGGQKLLSMNRLVLVPSLTPLLRREISIKSVTIDGLRASLRRSPDGNVEYPFVVAPVASPHAARDKSEDASSSREVVSKEGSDAPQSGLKWSIESISLADGRIDFIDRQTADSDQTAISLTDMSASLRQQKPGNAFAVAIRGQLEAQNSKAGSVDMTGVVALTEDLSSLQRATATVASPSLLPQPFQLYLPLSRDILDKIRLNGTRCTVTWEKGQPCVFSFESRLAVNAGDSAVITLQGEGSAPEDFSHIEKITAACETERLPLGSVSSFLPRDVPWDPVSGFVTAKLHATWISTQDWRVDGAVDLSDITPKGMVAAVAKQVAIRSQMTLNPQQLRLEKVEISQAAQRLAVVTGSVEGPFSREPGLDLTVESSAQPQWLKGIGVRLPNTLNIAGSIPLRAHMKGPLSNVSVDVNGDLTPTRIQVSPVLEKPEGERASVEIKGSVAALNQPSGPRSSHLWHIRLNMPSPRLQLRAQGPPLSGWALNLDCGVLVKGKAADIKDAVLTLKRRHRKAGDDLVMSANVESIESAHPKIKGSVAALLEKETIAAVMGALPRNLGLSGETRGKVSFSGTTTALDWTLDLPFSSLGIDVEKTFRKPAGVAADLKASGKWANESLSLDAARLSLPGIAVTGKGILRDRNSSFGDLSLQIKQADLKDLIKFLPSLTRVKVSGPLEADVVLKPAKDGIVPHASIRLISVDYQAEKNGWKLSKIRGTVKTDGSSMNVPEITGNILGAVDAPVKVTGNVTNISAVKDMNGRVSLEMGKGRIKAERLRKILQPVQLLVGTLLNPQALGKKADFLELDSLAGDFEIKSGTAHTANLRLKGADLGAGAIGSIRLHDGHLDAIAGLHTVLVTNDAIGKIPEVRRAVKKYEGLLKATGLDKELKRVGIDVNDKDASQQEPPKIVKTPVTVIVKVRGDASSPDVMPVSEDSLGKDVLSQLKSLMN